MPHGPVIPLPAPLASVALVTPPEAPDAGRRRTEQALEAERRAVAAQRERLCAATSALAAAAQALQDAAGRVAAEAEAPLAALALAVARKVVGQEIADGNVKVAPLVRAAMAHLPTRKDVTVRLHPADLDEVQAAAADLPPGVHLAADASVCRGECTVETPEGGVGATLADRFEAAVCALEGAEP